MTDTFYTCKELANILKVHVKTVRRMITNKVINAVNVGSDKRPTWRIYDADLQRFMAEEYTKRRDW